MSKKVIRGILDSITCFTPSPRKRKKERLDNEETNLPRNDSLIDADSKIQSAKRAKVRFKGHSWKTKKSTQCHERAPVIFPSLEKIKSYAFFTRLRVTILIDRQKTPNGDLRNVVASLFRLISIIVIAQWILPREQIGFQREFKRGLDQVTLKSVSRVLR